MQMVLGQLAHRFAGKEIASPTTSNSRRHSCWLVVGCWLLVVGWLVVVGWLLVGAVFSVIHMALSVWFYRFAVETFRGAKHDLVW